MKWKLQISDKRNRQVLETLLLPAKEWIAAREYASAHDIFRQASGSDFKFRCDAWSAYLGKNVTDWESID